VCYWRFYRGTFGARPAILRSTRDMNSQSRIARLLAALTICCVALVMMPATASASVEPIKPPAKVKVSAKLLDTKVKVNGKARIQGRMDVELPVRGGLELIVVQELRAGVWVDLQSSSCRPNATFRLSVSFSLVSWYTLRVYHPETALFASASSDSFVLAVVP
jgi:hypothetical protein